MSNRWEQFSDDERNLLQEALAAYSDEDISDDDFYDEDERQELGDIRDRLTEELAKV